MSPLMRHIEACRNVQLPGRRLTLRIGAAPVGWVTPEVAAGLRDYPALNTGLTIPPAQAGELEDIAGDLSSRGWFRLRHEAFDVRAGPDGPALARVDRGALPVLGIRAQGVHVNGLVRRRDGIHLWVARRAADKALDPGKLDHLVAGGVAAGMDARATLLKEAAEEAGLPEELAARAEPVGRIAYTMERAEGLRRDLLHCFDLELPESFVPRPADDEVQEFELWPLRRALQAVAETDDFKFNVNLVLIDLFLRTGLVDPHGAEGAALRQALDAGES
ncbi:MAG: NUDIX domain-containing protein [Acidisphaera sp.]|nr:NUDIX domain-containing protein [Acidisphaera sp.]